MKLIDISGKRFGRLLVVRREGVIGGFAAWRCMCDCGAECVKAGTALRSGHVTSCGCFKQEVVAAGANTKHGMRKTATYSAWSAIKNRCHNENSRAYPDYGGRGIAVCDRWRNSFAAFLSDMGEKPPGLSIDRINNAKGYEPGNCRWATAREQANNTRRNVLIAFGSRNLSVSEWAREVGLTPDLVKRRLAKGWSVERALTEPVHAETRRKT